MKYKISIIPITLTLMALILSGCQRSLEDLEPAEFPKNPNVFINEFSGGLNYAAFGGSVPTAFQVDMEVTRNNISTASMRFEVPDENDPRGAYAGGAFFTEVGRNLTEFDALTFWIKASKSANIDILGFGNDLGEARYQASISGLPVNTNWQKIILPIPDPSKLTAERGMFFYSEGPEEGRGYTFWIDEMKFEKLGTVAHPKAAIMGGEDVTVDAEISERIPITGLQSIFNLPTGVNQAMDVARDYFEFTSSDPAVATYEAGIVTVLAQGSTQITATLGGIEAEGSLIINSTGQAVGPTVRAPVPDKPADQVISMYTSVYPNVNVDTWNTRWQFSNAEEFYLEIQGDSVIRYRNLNFVGIEFTSQTIDASDMTHFHMNIWTPDNTSPPNDFKILFRDFGPNNTFDESGDDSFHEVTIRRPTLVTGEWTTIDLPLTAFTGLVNRANLAQLVLSGSLPNVYMTNVYFYNDGSGGGGETMPTVAAPVPTDPAADVISLYSDTYTNVVGTNFNPNWGQATAVSQVTINGNNTLRYGGLNYQGTALANNLDISEMNFLHIDYWTENSNALSFFLISPGPVETPYALEVPTDGWKSVDIPLSEFSPVDLQALFQLKAEGNGTIYLDNIYFKK